MSYVLTKPQSLSLVRRYSKDKGVYHYGILDSGNTVGFASSTPWRDVIVHLTYPMICWEWEDQNGPWEHVRSIPDIAVARQRIIDAATNRPAYNLLMNNCEHFATFVESGKATSSQVVTGLFFSGMVIAIVVSTVKSQKTA